MARRKFPHTWYVAALMTATLVLSAPSSAKTELWVFSSPHCGPCQILKPTLAAMESEGYPIRHVDITQRPALASQYRVSRVPCLIMVQDGRELSRQSGGDRSTVQRMFAAAGVRPGQQPPPTRHSWENDTTPPALETRPQETQHQTPLDIAPDAKAMEAKLLEHSVRITVEDASGKSYGTGTIIDTLKEDALIVTCGHLFRSGSSQQQVNPEQFQGRITIEQFCVTPSGLQVKDRSVAELMYCDLDRDVALVSFRPAQRPKVAPVAASFVEQVHDRVWSVGCDRGADPTVRNSRVTDINRYNGPPNIETSGAPVQGRSGGGLFNSRGELIGVCFAADNEGNEGLYSGLASVHVGLDTLNLQHVYRGGPAPGRVADARTDSARPAEQGQMTPLPDVVVRSQTPSEMDSAGQVFPAQPSAPPVAAGPAAAAPAAPRQPLSNNERAALEEIARRGIDSEVTVIVRPQEPGGKSVIFQLDRVSPQFAEELSRLVR